MEGETLPSFPATCPPLLHSHRSSPRAWMPRDSELCLCFETKCLEVERPVYVWGPS